LTPVVVLVFLDGSLGSPAFIGLYDYVSRGWLVKMLLSLSSIIYLVLMPLVIALVSVSRSPVVLLENQQA